MYDNIILATGRSFSPKTLRNLSVPRFLLHATLPLLSIGVGFVVDMLLCVDNAQRRGRCPRLLENVYISVPCTLSPKMVPCGEEEEAPLDSLYATVYIPKPHILDPNTLPGSPP